MPFIWSGAGAAVIVVVCFWFIACSIGGCALWGSENLSEHTRTLVLISGLLSSISIWFLGRRFNRTLVRVTRDGEEKIEDRYDVRHSLFFIPFEYWAIPVFLFTAWYILTK